MRFKARTDSLLAMLVAVGMPAALWGGCSDDDNASTSTSTGSTSGSGGAGSGDGSTVATGGGGAGGEGGAPFTGVCGPGLYHPEKNVYWGDLHVHTSYSIDSFLFANRNDPAAAYAFARGETSLPIASGADGTATATIDAPLDFAAVTDHSEFLTITAQCQLGSPGNEDLCTEVNDQGSVQQAAQIATLMARLAAADPPALPGCVTPQNMQQCVEAAQSAWQKTQEAAAAAYAPCAFTSLVAYEWTATTGGSNLHRNVIFSSGVVPDVPFDYINYPTALELWQALDAGCKAEDGCDVVTIPHNSNLSDGIMWDTADDPDPITRDYMARYQRLVEIYQHKGASECAAGGALADDECSFEDADDSDPAVAAPGYVRNGLAKGLMIQQGGGANPLTMGIVGATDTHNGTPGYVAEEGWNGHAGNTDETVDLRLNQEGFGPGSVTGVWAHENTREEIFAALKRRETYATSGPRIVVRFYVLDQVDPQAAQALCADPDFPRALLEAGAAPMGAEVAGMTSPTFFVAGGAAGTPLDRLDIVRIGLDDIGEPAMHLETFDLDRDEQMSFCRAWSESASFAAERPWLYYVRLLQAPTPRWSALDCQSAPDHTTCSDPAVPTAIRERAWTSPIFLSP